MLTRRETIFERAEADLSDYIGTVAEIEEGDKG
jgi:hypothetical protein